jgi:hypothetical protein
MACCPTSEQVGAAEAEGGMKPWLEYCDPSNWHEAAYIFPLMPDEEIQKLVVCNSAKSHKVLD